MMRFAANISMLFTDVPFLERPAAAARAGFPAVECQYPYAFAAEAFRDAVADAGIRLLGINTDVRRRGPDDTGIGAIAGLEQEAQALFLEALDYARHAGGSAIHVKPGQGDPQDRTARALFVRHLRWASDQALESGIMLLIEPLNPYDNPGYFLGSSDQAADILHEVDRPNVRMMFDVYHVQIVEGDLMRRFTRHLPVIGHVQIAAVPDRGEPDDGEVAFGPLLRHIRNSGYAGWIGAEYRPRGTTAEGLGWLSGFRSN